MQKEFQTKFHSVVSELMNRTPIDETEIKYQSVIGMVYTLIEEGCLNQLDTMIRNEYPEYYTDIE
jgi:hypothetical protein